MGPEQELTETAIGGVFGGRGFLVRRLCSVLVECPLPHPWIDDVLLKAMGALSNARYGPESITPVGERAGGCFLSCLGDSVDQDQGEPYAVLRESAMAQRLACAMGI